MIRLLADSNVHRVTVLLFPRLVQMANVGKTTTYRLYYSADDLIEDGFQFDKYKAGRFPSGFAAITHSSCCGLFQRLFPGE